MVQSKAQTVEEYLLELPKDRRETITSVREVILKNLPQGYVEVIQYGMICYIVPFSIHPHTYNNQPLCYISLASQKNHLSLYLMNIYSDEKDYEWFTKAYKATGKKLNMGKSCVRFKTISDLPLDVIARAIAMTSVKEFIKRYEDSRKSKKTVT